MFKLKLFIVEDKIKSVRLFIAIDVIFNNINSRLYPNQH